MTRALSYRRILHRMGYYNYQRGLIYHHLDEEGSWNEHLRNCREFILRCVRLCEPPVVTVLGSGWLLDVPLRELHDEVDIINLVDIVHPPEVREQVKDLKKVILREDDISGGLIEQVWRKAGKRTFINKLRSIEGIEINEYSPQFSPGLVISLNIITQLESLPVALLEKKSRADENTLRNFRKIIQEKHMKFLKRHKSVLITDSSEVINDSSGLVQETSSLLVDLPLSEISEEWTWKFDYRKSDYYTKKSFFKVKALLI